MKNSYLCACCRRGCQVGVAYEILSCLSVRIAQSLWACMGVFFCAFLLWDPKFLPWFLPSPKGTFPPSPWKNCLSETALLKPCVHFWGPLLRSVLWLFRTLSGTLPAVMGCLFLGVLLALSPLLFSKLVPLPLSFCSRNSRNSSVGNSWGFLYL